MNVEASAGISTAQSSLGLSSGTGTKTSVFTRMDDFDAVMPVYERYGQIGGVFGLELMDYQMDSNMASFGSMEPMINWLLVLRQLLPHRRNQQVVMAI